MLSPGDLPDPRTEPGFPVLQGDSLPSKPPSPEILKKLGRLTNVILANVLGEICSWIFSQNV